MIIGVVGKTNVGKSSFFKAATMIDVEISNRTFVTIKPNVGVAHVTMECPCKSLNVKCSPRNSACINHTRLIPIKLLDVAGLIPGAHEGKGLGNQFLNDLIPANALIHVIDLSGTTDENGNPTSNYDPGNDIKFLEDEIDHWFENVITKNLEKIKEEKKVEVLTGIGIPKKIVEDVIEKVGSEPRKLAKELRFQSKPMVVAANKSDTPWADKNYKTLLTKFPDKKIIPCSAEVEIILKTAAKAGAIEYFPGSANFKVSKPLNQLQLSALELAKNRVLEKFGNTGVQNCLNYSVFELLKYFPVYPVENENKFSDSKGNVLPDVFLMPENSTARDLAYKVHTDIGERFIGAIDCRTKKRVAADYRLKPNDIISILIKK